LAQYIWQTPGWPDLSFNSLMLLEPLGRARLMQGRLLGKAQYAGINLHADILTEEAFTTAAIEGEILDRDSIRSSVAWRLGLPSAGLSVRDRNADGLVEMLLDATIGHDRPLTTDRLKSWHATLFPTGYSGMDRITVADWRKGSVRVVSGPVGKERIHFEAVPARRIESDISLLLKWWIESQEKKMDGLIRAGLAHFRFVTIHPFDDGNGRIARALADMALAQDEANGMRMYSMSSQIMKERDDYYTVLEKTQKGTSDVTQWLIWFLECLTRSMRRAEEGIKSVMDSAVFWKKHALTGLNNRQRKVVNRLLDEGPDGFEGGLTNRKYVSMTKTSRETAKRDIADLIEKGILRKNPGRGRSTSYHLVMSQNDTVADMTLEQGEYDL